MESLHYLVLVNLYLLLFYGFYYLLLQKETFFRLNRFYLVGCAALSFLIPFIQLEWIKSLFITEKVQEVTFIYSMMGAPAFTPVERPTITAGDVLAIIYLTGLAVFMIRFVIQLISVKIHLNRTNTGEAFSFFKQIKVDNCLANHEVIMEHEQVHAKHFHSADIILFELIAIINWFNPIVYFYKKAIKNIHEFTADEVAASYAADKTNYSMILLSNAFGVEPHQLTNSFFNQSLLKQRIYMLNKTKSKTAAILKYGLSAPLFAAMLVLSSATIKERVEKSEQIAKLESHNLGEAVSAAIPKVINKAIKSDGKLSSATTSQQSIEQKNPSTTQTDTTEKVEDFATIDVLPEFPGGQEGFAKYISANFTYSPMAREHGVSGKVIVSFVVEKDGDLTDIKVLRDMGLGTGAEAVRVLEDSPKWKPGKQKGKLVRVSFTLPIALNLVVEDEKTGINIPLQKDIKYSADDSVIYDKKKAEVRLYGNPQINPTNPNALYFIDGKQTNKKNVDALKPTDIKSMNVLESKSATDKYGDKGKNGAVEITMKKAGDYSSIGLKTQPTNENKNFDFKGLVYINGKEKDNSKRDVLKSIKSEDIKSMNAIRPVDAIKRFGSRAKDGVIEITLKNK